MVTILSRQNLKKTGFFYSRQNIPEETSFTLPSRSQVMELLLMLESFSPQMHAYTHKENTA
jgi:hypothetical protein